jgi:transmembrane protein EpsG
VATVFYLILFVLLVLIASFDVNSRFDRNSRAALCLFLFCVFWLVAGLRYETGVDWPGYTDYFHRSKPILDIAAGTVNLSPDPEFEFGFGVLISSLRLFTDNVQWLFLIAAFASSLTLFTFATRYSNHLFVSLLLYYSTIYFVMDMDGIRQCIVLNVFLLSLRNLVRRNFGRYCAAMAAASLFHQTAWLLLPLYFVLNRQISSRTILLIVCAGAALPLFQIKWMTAVIQLVIENVDLGSITAKLQRYVVVGVPRQYGVGFVVNLVVLGVFLANRRRLGKIRHFNLFLNMFAVGLLVYYSTWELGSISGRFRVYLAAGSIVLFAHLVDLYRDPLKRYAVFSLIVLICLFYGRSYFFEMPEAITYNPYQNYLVHVTLGLESSGRQRNDTFSAAVDARSIGP